MAFDERLADRVRTVLHARRLLGEAALIEKRMFGCLVFMINGNMCCGVRNTELMLRLSIEGADNALKRPHTRPIDPRRKRVRSLIFVNELGTDLDHDLEDWVDVALAYVRALPAQDPSAKRRAPKKSTSSRTRPAAIPRKTAPRGGSAN